MYKNVHRDLIDQEFGVSGRGSEWKRMKLKVRQEMRKSREAYYERELEKIYNANDKKGLAYTALKNLNCPYRPKQWSVLDMFPRVGEEEAVETLAEYFNSVTSDHIPVDSKEKPVTYDRPIFKLTREMIERRIKESRKPNSTVPGDVPPSVLTEVASVVAIPLESIYNTVPMQNEWPSEWKKEYQTIIPKKQNPQTMADLRNLSCTNFFSKVLESFVVDSIKSEICLSELQYGGLKGCGTDNFLVEVWNNMLETLDTGGTALSLMSVDFSKAFNRLNHTACLKKLAEKNASNQTIGLVCAFLNGRKMCVRTGSTTSKERDVAGGSPQGTKLGNLLFCIAIDDITYPVTQQVQLNPMQSPPHSPISAIPNHHRPRIESTPIHNPHDDSFDPNPHGLRRKLNVINDTLPYPKTMNVMENETWEIGYVDDLNVGETLKLEDGIRHFTENKELREIAAPGSERTYEDIKHNGALVGMQINAAKTQLLCIHSLTYADVRSVVSIENKKVTSGEELKILGFKFGVSPSPGIHVDYLKGKFNKTLWSLVHLKRAGMKNEVLVRVYKCMVRPMLEFGCNVICSMLNSTEKEILEACQRKALRVIFGFEVEYEEMLREAGIERLQERRRTLFEKFTMKMASSERFSRKWLPLRNTENDEMALRKRKKYVEFQARTDRLYNSPVFEMRRFLNTL